MFRLQVDVFPRGFGVKSKYTITVFIFLNFILFFFRFGLKTDDKYREHIGNGRWKVQKRTNSFFDEFKTLNSNFFFVFIFFSSSQSDTHRHKPLRESGHLNRDSKGRKEKILPPDYRFFSSYSVSRY